MLLLFINNKSKPQIYTICKHMIYCTYKPNIYNDSMRKEEPNLVLVERLTEITDRGVTKADMARIAGVTPQAVNGWFKKGVISKKSALAIADAVGISVAWLLGEDVDEKDGLKPDEQRLLELYRQLPDEEQKNMHRIFAIRLKELDELYEKYMNRRVKSDNS
ncbi:helix-turn-helix domain-containing protein [Klebsiella pneumoniae]|nr:helix-turn-helix domain-containing protein [Klebsiella pneumoniae]